MLSVKARLSVKVLVWKIFHILMQIKFGKILHLSSFWKWEFFCKGSFTLLWPMKFVGYKSRPQGTVVARSKKEKTLGTMLLTHVSWRTLEHKQRRCNNFAIFAFLVNFFWLEMSKVVCYDVTVGDHSEIQKVWLYFRVRYTMEPKIVRCDMKLR